MSASRRMRSSSLCHWLSDSDLAQLESATLATDLKAHYRLPAEISSDHAEQAQKVRGRPAFRKYALLVAVVVLIIVAMGGWIALLGWLMLKLLSAFI